MSTYYVDSVGELSIQDVIAEVTYRDAVYINRRSSETIGVDPSRNRYRFNPESGYFEQIEDVWDKRVERMKA